MPANRYALIGSLGSESHGSDPPRHDLILAVGSRSEGWEPSGARVAALAAGERRAAAARLGSSPEMRDRAFPGSVHDDIMPRMLSTTRENHLGTCRGGFGLGWSRTAVRAARGGGASAALAFWALQAARDYHSWCKRTGA
jgi:hypothetical protein